MAYIKDNLRTGKNKEKGNLFFKTDASIKEHINVIKKMVQEYSIMETHLNGTKASGTEIFLTVRVNFIQMGYLLELLKSSMESEKINFKKQNDYYCKIYSLKLV